MMILAAVVGAAMLFGKATSALDHVIGVKETARLVKKKKKLPKELRDARLVNDTFLLTEEEYKKLKACPKECLLHVLQPASARAKAMEPMLVQSKFGKKCKGCGTVHPVLPAEGTKAKKRR